MSDQLIGTETGLSAAQLHILNRIPEDETVHIRPFDAGTREAAGRLLINLRTALPHATIMHIGGTHLGIAGEQTIDIIIVDAEAFKTSAAALESFFGVPDVDARDDGVLRWKCMHGGFPVHIYLAPHMTPNIQEAHDVQRLLESRGDLRSDFERLKISCDGLSQREYTRKKFEFFNTILPRKH